ncbi:unnamed protein product [Blepharisma stoltei]|uniref:Uncharacterized protein n=1 Tax=Blepharisma stoltei TaxID=1481888 RepID=A0AAU9IYJ6_9CILI|nr:unnamed protein product [Blepharisma stoltei]
MASFMRGTSASPRSRELSSHKPRSRPPSSHSKYKSPYPSPNETPNSAVKHAKHDSLILKENLNMVIPISNYFSAENNQKIHDIGRENYNKPNFEGNKLNDRDAGKKEFFMDFEEEENISFRQCEAPKRKENDRIDDQIREKIMENRKLLDMIKAKELEIQGKIYQENKEITEKVQENERILQQLELERHDLRIQNKILEQEKKKIKELSLIDKENSEVLAKNLELEKEIQSYKRFGISKNDYLVLQGQIKELEGIQDTLLSQNTQLKQELQNQQKINRTTSESSKILAQNAEELFEVYNELIKLSHLVKCYQKKEGVNLVQLLAKQYEIPQNLNIQVALSQVKNEINSLRTMASDVYAEQCGNVCISQ